MDADLTPDFPHLLSQNETSILLATKGNNKWKVIYRINSSLIIKKGLMILIFKNSKIKHYV